VAEIRIVQNCLASNVRTQNETSKHRISFIFYRVVFETNYKLTAVVLFDLSKAFDSIDHRILLAKL